MRERERIAKSKCQRLTETSTLPARPLGAQTQPSPGLMEKAGPCPTGGSAPEEVARCEKSYTGQFLREKLP